jgi:cobalt-zinc-cadmium efflux system membrane fusion protein
MNTSPTAVVPSEPRPEVRPGSPPPREPETPPGPKRLGFPWKTALLVAGCGAAAWAAYKYPAEAERAWRSVAGPKVERKTDAATPPASAKAPWDGLLALDEKAREAVGIATEEVKAQTDPIRLELLGTTDYITDTLTKIRPMFKGRVDKVYITVSQAVKRGDPLIDLYSKDLAEAKSFYEVERIQWVHDKWLLDTREPLAKSGFITQTVYEETKNTEMKSHKEFEVARDKLSVYGLTDQDVEKVPREAGSQKARMTLRAPTDGFVIERDVVPGNLYDENDNLLVIAPLDRLWVWGNVFESDLDLVKLGQSWEIRFPFLENKLRGTVEYISNRVDPNTHAVRIRTSIPNAGGKLKSDMLVRGMLAIPPQPGRTVIPRTALVVDDGRSFAFIRKEGDPGKFERRVVVVAQEKDDHAVIDHGLKPGEQVVTVGGLILAQVYENLNTAQTGAPPISERQGVD